MSRDLTKKIASLIEIVPFHGIDRFVDISGLLADPIVLNDTVEAMCDKIRALNPTAICGLDSRGFLFGVPIALRLHLPFIMIRKKGKLPGDVVCESFRKEYGSVDEFEIQSKSIKPGDRPVIVDDIIATGGSMNAGIDLIKKLGASHVHGVCFIDLQLQTCISFENKIVTSLYKISEFS